MGHFDSMTILEISNNYSIGLINDTTYNPGSSDNLMDYARFYSNEMHPDYHYLTRHGIFILKNDEIETSICICSSGGHTGIHPTCAVFEYNHLTICCADSIFCLRVPELDLAWMAKADFATCFEIFKYEDGYIVHGELEISRLDKDGSKIWQFSGSDIFTTPTGKNDFILNGNVIEAVCWDGVKFKIDARTGQNL
jgi:hypothetical protein